jgi:hypothetical protein
VHGDDAQGDAKDRVLDDSSLLFSWKLLHSSLIVTYLCILLPVIAYMKIVKTAMKIKRTFFCFNNGALKAHVLSHFVTLCHTCHTLIKTGFLRFYGFKNEFFRFLKRCDKRTRALVTLCHALSHF